MSCISRRVKVPKIQRQGLDIADIVDWDLKPISNGFVSSKIYDKRDDFNFDIVNFPFLDGDVPRLPSYGVNIS